MIFFETLAVALSTYSIIPMPDIKWNEKNMRYAICFLPVVGVLCGALVFLFERLCAQAKPGAFTAAAVSVCIPLIVSGGIHMDGFMDTVDALSSHAPKEKKLEIMKDPHAGAFSVIYCGIYLILNLAFLYEIYLRGSLLSVCPVYALSRSVSVLCAVNLPKAGKSGMLAAYTKDVNVKAVNVLAALSAFLCLTAAVLISPEKGALTAAAGGLWTAFYCVKVKKEFGGVTGDTAGFFLQMFELLCFLGIMIGAMI